MRWSGPSPPHDRRGERRAERAAARELSLRSREVEREIAELGELVRHLRTAADWIRMPESADVAGAS